MSSFENTEMSGAGGSIFDDAIALETADQKFRLGQLPNLGRKREFKDGRIYRFCTTDADLTAGELNMSAQVNSAATLDNLVDLTVSTGGQATPIGSDTLVLDISGLTLLTGGVSGEVAVDDLAGFYLLIVDGTGAGPTYRIKGNAAQLTGTEAGRVLITLYDPLLLALSESSDVQLIADRFSLLARYLTANPVTGVNVVPTTASTDSVTQGFWVQTHGIAAVAIETGTSIAIGTPAAADDNGGCKIMGADTDLHIGTFVGTETGGHAPVDLNII